MGKAEDAIRRRKEQEAASRRAQQERNDRFARRKFPSVLRRAVANLRRHNYELPNSQFRMIDGEERVMWRVFSDTWLLADGRFYQDGRVIDTIPPSLDAVNGLRSIARWPKWYDTSYAARPNFQQWVYDWLVEHSIIDMRRYKRPL